MRKQKTAKKNKRMILKVLKKVMKFLKKNKKR